MEPQTCCGHKEREQFEWLIFSTCAKVLLYYHLSHLNFKVCQMQSCKPLSQSVSDFGFLGLLFWFTVYRIMEINISTCEKFKKAMQMKTIVQEVKEKKNKKREENHSNFSCNPFIYMGCLFRNIHVPQNLISLMRGSSISLNMQVI